MKVTFTGINNLYVGRNIKTKQDLYLNNRYHPKVGNVKSTTYKIKCELTDDFNGKDFTYFKQQLEKLPIEERSEYIDKDNPHKVTMYVRYKTVANDSSALALPSFVLNDKAVFGTRESLPIFSIMAYISRKAANQSLSNSEPRKAYNEVNRIIHEKAIEIIENDFSYFGGNND